LTSVTPAGQKEASHPGWQACHVPLANKSTLSDISAYTHNKHGSSTGIMLFSPQPGNYPVQRLFTRIWRITFPLSIIRLSETQLQYLNYSVSLYQFLWLPFT
jgi:hypothetical protein